MDSPTLSVVCALLALLVVGLLYLLRRASLRHPGEYRVVSPVALPPTGALADLLYQAYRAGRLLVQRPTDEGMLLPIVLAGCSAGEQAGWRAAAARVERIVAPPKEPGQGLPRWADGAAKTAGCLLVLLMAGAPALMVLLGGCASQLTHDRQQLTEIVQVQRAAVLRLQSGDSACQGKIVGAAKQREVAVRQLAAYRDRRKIVEAQVGKAATAADEAQDQLLLSAPAKTDEALFRVRAETAALRAQVQQLLEGC